MHEGTSASVVGVALSMREPGSEETSIRDLSSTHYPVARFRKCPVNVAQQYRNAGAMIDGGRFCEICCIRHEGSRQGIEFVDSSIISPLFEVSAAFDWAILRKMLSAIVLSSKI